MGLKTKKNTLKKCITSLQNQTITDINILVVDGLSVDKTPHIVREISGKDPRVKLLINPQEVIGSA
nr:glycosyltransferase [Methanobacterium formicicum]